jgi:drebrin-like protein
MKRVRDASGAKYSVHNESTRRAEPIAPVGTNYTPVGKVDIGALRKGATKDTTSSKVVSGFDNESCR